MGCPPWSAYVPNAHLLHDDAPNSSEYLPVVHWVQLLMPDDAWNCPWSHWTQVRCEPEITVRVPGPHSNAHAKFSGELLAYARFLYLPPAHSMHDVFPISGW